MAASKKEDAVPKFDVMAFLEAEMSPAAFEEAKAIGTKHAMMLLAFLEQQLPPAALAMVQAELGVEL